MKCPTAHSTLWQITCTLFRMIFVKYNVVSLIENDEEAEYVIWQWTKNFLHSNSILGSWSVPGIKKKKTCFGKKKEEKRHCVYINYLWLFIGLWVRKTSEDCTKHHTVYQSWNIYDDIYIKYKKALTVLWKVLCNLLSFVVPPLHQLQRHMAPVLRSSFHSSSFSKSSWAELNYIWE